MWFSFQRTRPWFVPDIFANLVHGLFGPYRQYQSAGKRWCASRVPWKFGLCRLQPRRPSRFAHFGLLESSRTHPSHVFLWLSQCDFQYLLHLYFMQWSLDQWNALCALSSRLLLFGLAQQLLCSLCRHHHFQQQLQTMLEFHVL